MFPVTSVVEMSSVNTQPNSKTMKILVIGAGGGTGRAVVEQAVATGQEVTAFVHKADEYNVANVRVIEADAADSAAMDAAVLGQDAALDTIGGKTPYKETTLESSDPSTIIKSMQRNGARRLVVTSMLGEGESKANAPIYVRLLVATFLRGANKDKAAMVSTDKSSGLDWIILRPAILTSDCVGGREIEIERQTRRRSRFRRREVFRLRCHRQIRFLRRHYAARGQNDDGSLRDGETRNRSAHSPAVYGRAG